VGERRRLGALDLGDDRLRERLAQFDAPLVERVDVPDDALGEDAVLFQRGEAAEELRRERAIASSSRSQPMKTMLTLVSCMSSRCLTSLVLPNASVYWSSRPFWFR
jgi:hypothetical protein